MLEVTVKTLDGKNKSFSVPDNLTVKQFKEKISNSIVIPADKQRLIYQGKVLQDDKTLGFYGVHGKVIHAVERSPPTASVHGSGASTSTGATSATATTTSGNASITQRGTSSATAASPQSSLTNVMGSFTLPTTSPANHVQDIVQNVLSGFGSIGRNATVTTRATDSGSSVDVHINLGPIEPPQPESEAQQRLTQARRMIRRANATIDRLENPLSTTSSSASARCRSATDDAAPTAMDLEPTPTPEASSTDELPDPASTSAAADNRDMPHEGHRTAETTTEGEESHVPGGGAEDGEMSSGTGSEETSDEDMDDTPQDSATEPQSQDSDMAETTDTDAENSTSTTASAGTAVTVSTAVASAECVRSASPPEPEESSGVPAGVLAGSTAAASDGGAAVTAAPHNTDGAATSSGSTASTTTNSTRDGHQHRRVRHPHPPALGNMLTELMTLNARLQPHMEAYQQLMSQDPPAENEASTRQRQRLCNLVSSAMHYISHAYHNLSDLMIDMGRATPRDLRATPTTHTSGIGGGIGMPSTGAAVFTHAIPIQAHIQIGNHPPAGNNNNPGTSNSNTNRTNGNASTSSNATSSSSSSSSSRTSATVASNVQLGQQGIPLSGAQSIPIPGGNLLAGQPLQISLPPAALDGILGGITNSLGNALEGLATGITSGPGIGVGGAPPGPLYTSGNLTATTNASSATSSGQLLGTTQSGAAQLATSSSNTSNPAAGSPAAASGGGAAGAPLASSDPVVFMELGPQAVTINSISAHLVETNPDGSVTTTPVNPDGSTGPSNATTSSASSTASGSGTNTAAPSLTTAPPPAMGLGEGALHDGPVIQGPGGAQIHVQSNIPGGVLPPNVMNTIMQSVAGLQSAFTDYAAPTHTASSTSSIQSNATNTSSTSNPANASQAPPSATTAASTASHGPSTEEAAHTGNAQRSNATPGQEPRMRMRVPRRGFPLRRSLNPDPHLPCNSHHFLHHRLNSTMHHRGMRNVNRRPYPHRHQRHHHHHRTAPAAGGGSSSNSRGVGNPQQRASSVTAPPAPQRAQQSGRSAASNTTEQDQNLTQMVENIVGSIIRQAQSQFPGAVGGVGLGGVAGATPIATIRMTAAPPGASPRPGAGGPRVMHHHRGGPRLQPHHRHHHHNHRSGGPRQTGAVPLARTMQGDARPTRGGAVAGHGGRQTGDLAAFAASLTQSLMSNQGPQPGAPRQSLGQFLTSFGDQLSFPTDNSILARLLQCILNNITLTDLTHIVLGNSEPLNGLLPHLQAVIRDHLLHNQPATPANVTAAVQEFIAEFDEDITACQRDFTGRDNINYTESVRRLAQHHLEILVKFIHEHNDQATFGAGLMARCKALCDEFLALSLHTLENGESDLRRFIQQRLMHLPGEGSGNTVSGGTDGQQTFIHTMLNSHITQYIHTRRNAIAVPLSTLNSYIIRNTTSTEQQQQQEASSATTTSTTSTPITSAQPAVPTDTIRSSGVVEVATCNNSAAPTHLLTTTPATAAASAASLPECEDDDVEMRSPVSSVLSEPAASLSPPVVPSPSDASPSAPSAPEGWQAVLPQEWVPIITTDIQRQAEQPPQQPFSDAYINGMPAKRRKITETKQQSVSQAELAGTGSVIPEAIEQAMVGAGVQPNTSVEALRQEAENDETLHQAFEQQVRASVRKRLDNDPDYVPEKYPNAEKFFKPQK